MVQSFAAELFGVSGGCWASRVLNHFHTAFKTLVSIMEGCGVELSPPGVLCTEKGVCSRSWAQSLVLCVMLPQSQGATSLHRGGTANVAAPGEGQTSLVGCPWLHRRVQTLVFTSAPQFGPALGSSVGSEALCCAESSAERD